MASRRESLTVKATAALLAASAILAGCGPTRSSGPVVTAVPLADASIKRGKSVFDANCNSCHLHGEGGMGPALNDKPLPRFLIRFQVRHGLGSMPAFPDEQISDQELEDLANYVAALRRHTR